MKKIFLTYLLFTLVGFFIVSKSTAIEITFACENKQDFPTIMGQGKKILEENPGMGVEMLNRLEKKLNLTITIKRMPWKRCLSKLEQGEIDGLFTASYKDKRKKFGRYPEVDGKVDPNRRFSSASYALYRIKGSDVQFDGKKFNIKGKVGAPAGYSIVDDLRKKGLKIDEGPSTLNDFKKLIKGRIKAVAALEMTGDFYLMMNENLNQKIEKIFPLIVEKPYYFMLSHQFYEKNKDLSEKIWDTMSIIRETPEFQKLLKNYF